MLNQEAAAAIAAAYLEEETRNSPGSEVRTAPEFGFVDGGRYIVPYNSVDLLDHGDLEAELGGNSPILVDLKTGECRFLEFDEVMEYRRRGFTV
jgi:hypothetical protein